MDMFTAIGRRWELSKLSPQFQRAKGKTPLKREKISMLSPEHQS